MNEDGHLILRFAISVYLIYLAYQIVTAQLAGESSMPDLLAYGASVLMGLSAVAFCVYAWLDYRKQKQSQALEKEEEQKDNKEQ